MKYCTNCGNKVEENSFVCTHCGVKIKNDVVTSNVNDNGGFAWSLLGFFVPVVGLILYLVWKDERPKTAKSAGKGALIYAIVYGVIIVVAFIFGFIFSFTDNSINSWIEDEFSESYYEPDYKFE